MVPSLGRYDLSDGTYYEEDNGVKIKLMESALFSLKTEDLSIKANGEMTYIMDGELYMHRQEIGINTRVSLKMV
jgi:hypothetical protein